MARLPERHAARSMGPRPRYPRPDRAGLRSRTARRDSPAASNFAAERPEILHAHDARGLNLAWLASQGLPVRRVANRDVTFHPQIPGGHWLQGWKYTHMAHLVVTCSGYIKRSLIRSGVPADRIEVIYPAIEWPEQPPSANSRSGARAAWGFGEQEFVASHVGAFTREKGQDIAIEAAALLKQRLPNIRIVLAGAISAGVLQDLRRRYPGLEGHIHLPGYIPDLVAFFAGLDLFIMPSRGEGLGISALQAMARRTRGGGHKRGRPVGDRRGRPQRLADSA